MTIDDNNEIQFIIISPGFGEHIVIYGRTSTTRLLTANGRAGRRWRLTAIRNRENAVTTVCLRLYKIIRLLTGDGNPELGERLLSFASALYNYAVWINWRQVASRDHADGSYALWRVTGSQSRNYVIRQQDSNERMTTYNALRRIDSFDTHRPTDTRGRMGYGWNTHNSVRIEHTLNPCTSI